MSIPMRSSKKFSQLTPCFAFTDPLQALINVFGVLNVGSLSEVNKYNNMPITLHDRSTIGRDNDISVC